VTFSVTLSTFNTLRGMWHGVLEPLAVVEHAQGLCPMSLVCLPAAGISVSWSPGRAKPLARDYWTLSVWKDDAALRQFMRTPPHVHVMTSLKPFMGPTKFVTWTISAADGRPSMAAALEHLAAG
jgi:hypothetical protein